MRKHSHFKENFSFSENKLKKKQWRLRSLKENAHILKSPEKWEVKKKLQILSQFYKEKIRKSAMKNLDDEKYI